MRVQDEKQSIYRSLEALPWHPSYLTAMWILCGELQSLYADWIEGDDLSLVTSTMELALELVTAGESSQITGRAADLSEAWQHVIAERKGPSSTRGLRSTFKTFRGLTLEIAGLSIRYMAAQWAPSAAEERWRGQRQGIYFVADLGEEIDNSSPMAETLTLFGRVISEVSAVSGPEWDPVRIRAQIIEQR